MKDNRDLQSKEVVIARHTIQELAQRKKLPLHCVRTLTLSKASHIPAQQVIQNTNSARA